jgi:hypothetical protein
MKTKVLGGSEDTNMRMRTLLVFAKFCQEDKALTSDEPDRRYLDLHQRILRFVFFAIISTVTSGYRFSAARLICSGNHSFSGLRNCQKETAASTL